MLKISAIRSATQAIPTLRTGLQQLLASAAVIAPPTYTAANSLAIDTALTSEAEAPQDSPPPYTTHTPSCTPLIHGMPPPTYDQALVEQMLATQLQHSQFVQRHLNTTMTSPTTHDLNADTSQQLPFNDALADDVIAHWERVLLPHSNSVATSPTDTLTSQTSDAGASVTSQTAVEVMFALRRESLSEARRRGCFRRPAMMWNGGSWTNNNRLMQTLPTLTTHGH